MEEMRRLPPDSVDLLFADPPYYMRLTGELRRPNRSMVNGVQDDWDKFPSLQAYTAWTDKWLKESKRVLKPNGAIWAIGMYHNIGIIGTKMQDNDFWLINDVIWHKTNAMPNFNGTRFANVTETLIWATKTKSPKCFRYHAMKTLNDDKQMSSVWEIPICNGGERIKNKEGKSAHSTQKPEALMARIIKATSNPGDLVLDIFSGTGTTLAVAKKLGRNYIGIEQKPEYVKIINKRLKKVKKIEPAFGDNYAERRPPRVAFGALLETGMIKIGEFLYSADESVQAHVNADGTVKWKKQAASIHKIGALAQKVDACNGWQFWFVRRRNKLVSIDKVREDYRKKYLTEK